MEFSQIIYAKQDRVATIMLNRPAKLNAYSELMVHQIISALGDARDDDNVRVVIITGTGRGFCSGGDISRDFQYPARYHGHRMEGMLEMRENMHQLVTLLQRFDKPVIAEPVNIHHNYAAFEHHFGRNVIVHRKGATSAREGEMGIIPGSQGTASYIVRGKGNPESFMSCSHGAGRKIGRRAAIKTLDLERGKKILDNKGILHALRGKQDLEEAAGAYKDIDVVMEEQQDLVDIVVRLEPLVVIKG